MPKVLNAYWWRIRRWRQIAFGGLKVHFIDPLNTYIGPEVKIGHETIIEPGAWIMGKTKIGRKCRIGFGSVIIDSRIGDEAKILGARIINSRIRHHADIGEARIERSVMDHHAEIGYTAQLKRTRFGAHSKMHHQGYLGDCQVGKNVNISAGVITGNYDGLNKNPTLIANGAFIGINVNLVAPLIIPESMIAAGSTLPSDFKIPPQSLVIARARPHISDSKKIVWSDGGWKIVPSEKGGND